MSDPHTTSEPLTVIVQQKRNPGLIAGILGCVFGVLGIVASGLIFVPLAALCSVVGIIRGVLGRSAAGIGTSALAVLLTIIGFVVSPTLWALLAAAFIVHSMSSFEFHVASPPNIGRTGTYALESAPAREQLADEDCFQGECFREFIVTATRKEPGLVVVRTRIEHFCNERESPQGCAAILRDIQSLPTQAVYEVRCSNPGYVQTSLGRVPEPDPNPPHVARGVRQLWTVVCSTTK